MLKPLFLAGISVTLAACAAYELPPVSMRHPANPQAMSQVESPRSTTLAYTRQDLPSPQPAATTMSEGAAAHQMEGMEKIVTGEGKVVAVVPSSGQLVVEHGEIKGFMDAMTMGYRVESPSQLEGVKAGDQVRFTIDVLKKTIVNIEKIK